MRQSLGNFLRRSLCNGTYQTGRHMDVLHPEMAKTARRANNNQPLRGPQHRIYWNGSSALLPQIIKPRVSNAVAKRKTEQGREYCTCPPSTLSCEEASPAEWHASSWRGIDCALADVTHGPSRLGADNTREVVDLLWASSCQKRV